jgi:hypothetical protein
MFKKLSLSIALYSLLITPLSPLGVLESYNIVDFVDRNFQTDDQSKPNRVKTHYTLSYQSPNILTNIEGVPNSDTQSKVSSQMPQMPKFSITVSQIDVINSEGIQRPIYIVEQVREVRSNNRTGRILYR